MRDAVDSRLLRSFFSVLLLSNSDAATPAPTAAAAAAAPLLRDLDRLELILRFARPRVASKEEAAGGGAGAGTISRVLL